MGKIKFDVALEVGETLVISATLHESVFTDDPEEDEYEDEDEDYAEDDEESERNNVLLLNSS